jgi:hypothetical protein
MATTYTFSEKEGLTVDDLRGLVAQLDGADGGLAVKGRVRANGRVRELSVEVPLPGVEH